MVGTFTNIRYWLIEHPTISEFKWEPGKTFGGSIQFLVTTVLTYLSLTAIIHFTIKTLKSKKSTANTSSTSTKSSSSNHDLLKTISAVHSFFLMVLSIIMAVGCTLAVTTEMPARWIFCYPPNKTPPSGPLYFWAYIFYLSKIPEFIDTLLIILNKEGNRRLSFLHVYHHAFTIVAFYIGLDKSQSLLPVAVITNSTVHIVMYGYYFLCSIGRRPSWKKSVTDCQILQFQFAFATSMVMLWFHFTSEEGCSGIRAWTFTMFFTGTLLLLFTNFHTKNYTSNNKKSL